jgi:tetratricopeptide (TPR) repeat protein
MKREASILALILALILASIFLAFKYPLLLKIIYIGSIGLIVVNYLFTSLFSVYTFTTARKTNANNPEALITVILNVFFSTLMFLMFYGTINMAVKSNNLDNSAILKIDKNDIAGALSDYNKSIELVPEHAKTYYNRGNLKADKLDDIAGALADYNKAIVLDPHYADAYNNRGNLKADKLDDIAGALADYNEAILLGRDSANELNPQSAHAYYNRGNLKADKLNDRPGAIKDFHKAADLYHKQDNLPSYQNAIDRLKQLSVIK